MCRGGAYWQARNRAIGRPHRQARSRHAPPPRRNRMREEFRTKPDYTGRKNGIDRDNRAVEGNACERRQACSLVDLRKGASASGYPRERVFRQAARVRCGSVILDRIWLSALVAMIFSVRTISAERSRRWSGFRKERLVSFGICDRSPSTGASESAIERHHLADRDGALVTKTRPAWAGRFC